MAQVIGGIVMPSQKKSISFESKSPGIFHIPVSEPTTPSGLSNRLCSMASMPQFPDIDIQFSDLTYTVPDKRRGSKRILSGLSGSFLSHKLSAIMGPSGSGKSTLLNVLAGYKLKGLTGSVMMNRIDRKTLNYYRRLVCYIMQEDHLMPHLTVLEAMTVATNLKLGAEFSNKAKSIIIDEILETLRLTETKETRTANLSGGQRKRLSIALELVSNPPIMFFDEPTSGLDSSSCFQCLSLLKSLARGGRTIVCSIHQPSARLFEMFDHLYTLAEGQCIYQGNINGLVPFLSSLGLNCPSFHNPADFMLEVASGDHGDVLPRVVNAVQDGKCALYCDSLEDGIVKQSNNSNNGALTLKEKPSLSDENIASSGFPISNFKQFWILLKRTNKCTMRDMDLFWLRCFSHLICGLLIGIVYWKIGNDAARIINNTSCLFFATLFLMFSAMMPTITTFPLERKVFQKEYMNHWYSVGSFYLAKTTADIPFQLLFAFLYIVMVYFMSAQPNETFRFLLFLSFGFMVAMVSQSLGLFIGIMMSVEKGVYIGPVCNLPILLFSGFLVNLSSIPQGLQWLSDISYIRYGFEGTMVAVYGFNRTELNCQDGDFCYFTLPDSYLEIMDMKDVNVWFDLSVLVGFLVFLRVLGYFMLKWNVSSSS